MKPKSPRTTVAGILTILISAASLALPFVTGGPVSAEHVTAAIAGILSGIGLITAKDHKAE